MVPSSIESTTERAESLAWTVRLSDKEPQKRIVIFLVAVTAGLLGLVVFRQPVIGILGFAIILASTAEYWAGVRFELTPKGATRRLAASVSGIDWEDVKRVVVQNEEITLSPLLEPSRMEPFRGITLRTNVENRDRVIDFVRQHCADDVRLLGI